MPVRPLRIALVCCVVLAASGCASVAVTLAGLGAGIGANHFIGSVSTKTFTYTQEDTKWATLAALKRMQVEIDSVESTGRAGELIKGRTSGREFEIELEPVSPTVTRMKSLVRMEGSLTLDGATAAELVSQTERTLTEPRPAIVAAPPKTAAPDPAMRTALVAPPAAAASSSPTAAPTTPATAATSVRPKSSTPTTAAKPSPAKAARAPAAAAPPPPPL